MSEPLAERHRQEQLALRAWLVQELRRVWPTLDPERLDETFYGWARAVLAIVLAGRQTSATLALAYLRQLRVADGVAGDPPIAGPNEFPPEVLLTSLAVTGPVNIKRNLARGVPLKDAVDASFVRSSLSSARHVLAAGRETTINSMQADRRAVGWRRVPSGRACDFCEQLARIEFTPDRTEFKAHDGCSCVPRPIYR